MRLFSFFFFFLTQRFERISLHPLLFCKRAFRVTTDLPITWQKGGWKKFLKDLFTLRG